MLDIYDLLFRSDFDILELFIEVSHLLRMVNQERLNLSFQINNLPRETVVGARLRLELLPQMV